MLKCVVVDDESSATDIITRYIGMLSKLDMIGVFNNAKTALDTLSAGMNFDLLFLDIDMPLLSGIDLAKVLRSKTQKLIFTTGHTNYALEAFEAEADAYLLKPYSFAKFSSTISRLFPNEAGAREVDLSHNNYFLVKNKEADLRIEKVAFQDVIAFESSHNDVKIHLANQKSITAYLTLKDIAEITKARPEFKQFHRAFIVSTNHISFIETNKVSMTNGLAFNIGDNYKDSYKQYLANKLITTTRNR